MMFADVLGRGQSCGEAAKLKGNPCEEETLNRVQNWNSRQIVSGFVAVVNPIKSDGDHPSNAQITLPKDPPTAQELKEIKDVHAMVRNHLNTAWNQPASSTRFWPVFVTLLEQDSELQISCTHDHLKA